MDYLIIATIKGEEEELRQVGEPTYLMTQSNKMRKSMVQDYVASNFCDMVDELSDITEIKYMKGPKVLFEYKYKKKKKTPIIFKCGGYCPLCDC